MADRRRVLALAVLVAAAAAAVATSAPDKWSLTDGVDLGPVAFPTGAPPLARHLTGTVSAAAFAASTGQVTASVSGSLCGVTDAGFEQHCDIPDGGGVVLEVAVDGTDAGYRFTQNANGWLFADFPLLDRCDAGTCAQGMTVTLRPESPTAPRINLSVYRAQVHLLGNTDGPAPAGSTLTLTEP